MLVLFAFSVTPRKLLHDVFANHKDGYSNLSGTPGLPQVSSTVFNCQCDNLVAESPFIDDSSPIEIFTPGLFAEYKSGLVTSIHAEQQFFFGLRGPPAIL